ncbi:MAG: hypothetical protein ACREAC_19720, partial [Blastocatellia bacterium]
VTLDIHTISSLPSCLNPSTTSLKYTQLDSRGSPEAHEAGQGKGGVHTNHKIERPVDDYTQTNGYPEG